MLSGIIKQFNWVDIFVVIILFRIGYIAIKNGLPVELFKLLGTLFATFLALHYYTGLADLMSVHLGLRKIPVAFFAFFYFLVLTILGYLIFVFFSNVFCRFIKMEATPKLNKGGGFILGIARGILVVSLVMFILVISSLDYFKNSVKDAYSGKLLFKVAPAIYSGLYNGIVSKFIPATKFNTAVWEVQENLTEK